MAAVLILTCCVDKEYRDRGIHVVGLSPGTVATDMQRAIKASGINPVSRMDFSQHIPTEWPARAVAWLCTDAARELDGGDFSLTTEAGRWRVGLVARSEERRVGTRCGRTWRLRGARDTSKKNSP